MALSDVLSQIPGYAGYQASRLRNQQQEQGDIQQAVALQNLVANIQKAEQSKALMGANPEQLKDPDFWSRMAVAQNKPEYETHAERLRKAKQEAATLSTMRGGIAPDIQEVQQAADQGTPAPMQPSGGIFDGLAQSPNPQIAQQAKALKASMDRAGGSIPPQYWQTQQAQLAARETALLNRPERQERQPHIYATPTGYFKDSDNGPQPVLGPNGKPLVPPSAGTVGAPAGNFSKSGEDYLATLSDSDRSLVKKIGSYEIDPKTLSTRGGQRERVLTMVSQAYPTYDDTQYANKRRAIAQFGSGPLGTQVRNINVAVEHMDTLERAASALENGNFTPGNKAYNEIAKVFGQTPPNTFEGIRDIVANEVAKGTIGGTFALADRQEAAAKVKAQSSPAQLKDLMNSWRELLGGQIKGLSQQYAGATGLQDFENRYIAPRTKEAISAAAAKATPSTKSPSGWGIRPL